jgi:STAM-binding protein
MILGWIHTHPQHALFLSAVDLHTQSNYQALLPEAVAIVWAPGEQTQLGVFRLTGPGIKEVQSCQKAGFHHHNLSCYEQAQNVSIQPGNVRYQVIDLR